MNPGAMEESGKVATAFIDSMKAQPLTLAVLVFNLVFVVLVYMISSDVRAADNRVMTALLTQQKDMIERIVECSPNKSAK